MPGWPAAGSEEDVLAVFRTVRDAIIEQIPALLHQRESTQQ